MPFILKKKIDATKDRSSYEVNSRKLVHATGKRERGVWDGGVTGFDHVD
jgi:hypothetical protein